MRAGRGAASVKVPSSVPASYVGWVTQAARRTGLPASIVAAQISEESGFNPGATSPAGAQGIAQFIPSTFASYGRGNPYNPQDALSAYINYMNALLHTYHGNVRNALSAYNSGGITTPGLQYADTILGNAGASSGITAPGGTGRLPGRPAAPAPTPAPGPAPPGGTARAGSVAAKAGGSTAPAPGGGGGGGPGVGFQIAEGAIPGLGIIDKITGSAAGVADVGNAIATISNTISSVLTAIDWIFKPQSWIRAIAFLGGTVSVGTGVILLAGSGGESSPLHVVKPAALPIGIASVGFGGILLFIAFHNLPDTVIDFPSLAGYVANEIRSGTQTAVAGGNF